MKTAVLEMRAGETRDFPASLFFADPDSIKGDMSFTSRTNNTTISNTLIKFTAPTNGTSATLNLSATHDFITVTKDFNTKLLPPDIYVPSGFTPNGDGRNDIFKPLYYGKLMNCRFVIFNRPGQKVFETTDCTRGWDGKIKGIAQTGTFVWTLSYQFEGENKKEAKGTVTLIR